MNKREIVIETLKHKRVEVVPYNIDFTVAMREKMRKHLGLKTSEELGMKIGNFCVRLNVGSVTGPSEGMIEEIYPKKVGEYIYRDDWGVIWKRKQGDDIGVVVEPVLKEASLKGFNAPVPLSRKKYLNTFCKENLDRFKLVSMSSPIFQRVWFLRGFTSFLMDMALNKKFVHELLDMIMVYNMNIIKEVIQYDIDGFSFLMIGDSRGSDYVSEYVAGIY